MSISKKLKFEVFKRDGFQCAYCGKSPPEVILEIDHIEPTSRGGNDDINNLLTACFDCNRGKRDILLDKTPNQLIENYEILKEKEEQLKEYRKLIKKIEGRIENDINEIGEIFNSYFENRIFTDAFKQFTVKKFLNLLPKHKVIEALHLACNRINNDSTKATKYFCGICWNWIKGIKPPYKKD